MTPRAAIAAPSRRCSGMGASAAGPPLCEQLVAEGVDRLHFYTLNKPDLTLAVCRELGVAEKGLAA